MSEHHAEHQVIPAQGAHMARTAAVLDALGESDRLIRRAHRRSDYALLKFAPAAALAVRAIVASPQRYCCQRLTLLSSDGCEGTMSFPAAQMGAGVRAKQML